MHATVTGQYTRIIEHLVSGETLSELAVIVFSNSEALFLAAWFKGYNSKNTGPFHVLFEINQRYEPN